MRTIFLILFILVFGSCTQEVTREAASNSSCSKVFLELTDDLNGSIRRALTLRLFERELSFTRFAEIMNDTSRQLHRRVNLVEVLEKSHIIHDAKLRKSEIDDLATFLMEHNIDDFNQFSTRLADRIFKYDVEIPRVIVRDQCEMSNCWIHAGTSFHEILYREKLEGIPLSDEYMTVVNLLEVVKFYAKELGNFKETSAGRNFLKENEGGSLVDFRELMNDYGIMPKDKWKPKMNIQDYEERKFLYDDIAKRMRELFSGREEISEKEIDKVIKREIKPIIEEHMGKIPRYFSYKNDYPTPQEFARENFFFDDQNRSFMVNMKAANYNQSSMRNEVKSVIVAELDAGNPIILSFKGKHPVLGSESSLFSEAASNAIPGRHQVVVVGYKLDARGGLARLKLANSWGEEHGDYGYLHMTGKYLWQTFDGLGVAH